jgi:hypothetical protein
MNAAEILRDGEMGRESPVRANLRPPQNLLAVGEPFSAKAKIILNHPAAIHGSPYQIDFSVGRQPFRSRLDVGRR